MRPPRSRTTLGVSAEECDPHSPPAPDDSIASPVYSPELLADLLIDDPAQARWLIAALSPDQRIAQARAQAAWLSSHGLPVSHHEILALWEAMRTL